MNQIPATPCDLLTRMDLSRMLPEKDTVEELDVLYQAKHHAVFVFNGYYRMTSNAVYIGDELMIPNLPLYGNCVNAISDTNKRFLEEHEFATDYIAPNPVLTRAIGFSESETKQIVYLRTLHDLPLEVSVVGYDPDGSKLSKSDVCFQLAGIEFGALTDEEAVCIIADFLLDNDLVFSAVELQEEYGTLEKAYESVELSDAAKNYGENGNADDLWEQLEFALAYEFALECCEQIKYIANSAYTLLHDRYKETEFILAHTTFSFGLDEDNVLCLTGEVGTTNNSLIVNEADFNEDGRFIQAHLKDFMDYITSPEVTEEIPENILDDMTDNIFYIAESLCGDLEFDVYIN